MAKLNGLVFVFCAAFCGSCGYRSTELVRVTDPTGRLDAVIVHETSGGAVGGLNQWSAYVVGKGLSVASAGTPWFRATTLDGERLVWNQPHLLELHYDRAQIDNFSNLTRTNLLNDPKKGINYWIEIRLVPTSDFSILMPNGDFKE